MERRSRHRLWHYLSEAVESRASGLSLLERKAITGRVSREYTLELSEFKAQCGIEDLLSAPSATVDAALVDFMEMCYFRGQQPSKGMKLLAGLLHFMLGYGPWPFARVARS